MSGQNVRYGQWLQTSRHVRTGPVSLALPPKQRVLHSGGQVRNGPVVDGDRVYVTSDEPNGWSLRCVDITSGELVWSHAFETDPEAIRDGELVLGEGAVLVRARKGVSVIDSLTGHLQREWRAEGDVVVRLGAVVDSVLYVNRDVSDGRGGVSAFDWLAGTVLWETGRSAGLASTQLAANKDLVFFNSTDSVIECLDRRSGQMRWDLNLSEIGRHIPRAEVLTNSRPEEATGYLDGPLLVLDGQVVVPVSEWGLLGVDCNTGKILWQNRSDNFAEVLPYTDAGCVLTSRYGSRFFEFDFKKRSIDREYSSAAAERELHPWLLNGCVAEDALILTAPRSSCVGAFSRQDGALLWRHDLRSPIRQTILVSNRLFVSDASGKLSVFESA